MTSVSKPSHFTFFFYGLSAIPFGIKDTGFAIFLMIYYNQILGLPAWMVGISALISLAADAVMDPWIGDVSDRLKTRFGGRLPLMYLAILPSSLAYWALWVPPDLSNLPLLAYLIAVSIALRGFIAVFEIPTSAILLQLVGNPPQRARWISFRTVIAWLSAVVMVVVAYQFFLVDLADGTSGALRLQAHREFGLHCAAVLGVSMLLSTLGLHRAVLSAPRDVPPKVPIFETLRQIFQVPQFTAVFYASMAVTAVMGLSMASSTMLLVFFYQFDSGEISLISSMTLPGVLLGFVICLLCAGRMPAWRVTTIGLWIAMITATAPILGLWLGLLPEPGTDALVASISALHVIGTAVDVTILVFLAGLIYDQIENLKVKSGQGREGTLLAGFTFVRKMISGIGIAIGGVMLSITTGVDSSVTTFGAAFIFSYCLCVVIGLSLARKLLRAAFS